MRQVRFPTRPFKILRGAYKFGPGSLAVFTRSGYILNLLTPLEGFAIILPHAPVTAPEGSEQGGAQPSLRQPTQFTRDQVSMPSQPKL